LPGDLLIVINFLGVGQQLGMIWDLLWTGFKNFLCTKTDLFLTGESYAGNQWLSVSSESVLHILKELLHILGIELKILPQRF
jgi:carboxypeptidase C (cathepsin A)